MTAPDFVVGKVLMPVFVFLRGFLSGTLSAFPRCRKEAVSLPWFIKHQNPHKHLFCYLLPALPEWNWDLLKFKEI